MMQYLKTYLQTIRDRGNVKLAESVSDTAETVGEKYLSKFSFMSHEIGLLFGNVQSGKTGQMFGIISKATDLGFPVFVLLTTDNVVLQQQTLDRVKADLKGFCICGENDARVFIDNELRDPVIVVLKKNVRVLKLWANIFNSTGFMRGNPLFIVDDEADAASLNTLVNQERKSSINKYLDSIKNGSSSSLYLQVTGTPQAVFLQTIESGWHPYFTHYFQPGNGYLGGDFFFPNGDKPICVSYIENYENPTKATVLWHLLVSAEILLSGGKVSNCLVHPSVRQAEHQKFADEIQQVLNWCKDNEDEVSLELRRLCQSINPEKFEKQSIESIIEYVRELLQNNRYNVLVMNGKNDVDSEEYETGCNFVIGGNTLGRGVTFPGLQTIYYTRTSKKPQADTMWQHSRMFGYDRDPGLMKVFIGEHLYKLFADINATNNSIIAQVERGINDVKIYYPNGINPTRKNVLDNDRVEIITGGTNYYPFNPDNDNIEEVSALLEPFTNDEPYYQVSLRLIKEVMSHIIESPDFNKKAFCSVLDTILAERPAGQGILIVRRERNVAQGTGALLSPNDWQLGAQFTDKVVLTIYKVTGTKGWNGKKLWVPNIKLPHDMVYYDVINGDA